jgi:CxxC motif-containing protein (DUF1111 family)
VTAPASTTNRDGLGPTFNAPACAACHVRDGIGLPPDAEHPTRAGLLLRLSVPGRDPHGGPASDPVYGTQLNDRAVNGVPAEGRVGVRYRPRRGAYSDGTAYELRAPTYSLLDLAFGPPSPDLMVSPRIAPAMIGMGLLEAIPEGDVVAAADPPDADGDGVSGRVNRVWNPATQRTELGRFGWKANVASVEAQVAGAFVGDIGITSPVQHDENCPEAQTACRAAATGGRPEVDRERFDDIVFYSRVLAVPKRRPARPPATDRAGAETFVALGCAACHTPEQRAATSTIPALSDRTIHPFTDLLLHDMGPGLADGRPEFRADGREWRTPPLWGLGLLEEVAGDLALLHDGRARTIEEAILWHGGEARRARERFRKLDAADRRELVAYLESL